MFRRLLDLTVPLFCVLCAGYVRDSHNNKKRFAKCAATAVITLALSGWLPTSARADMEVQIPQEIHFLDNGPKASYAVRKLAQEDRFTLWMTLPVGNIQVFFTNVYTNNEFANSF